MPRRSTLLFCVTALLATLLLGRCQNEDAASSHPGRELVQTYCASCHQLPEPGDLPREIWAHEILPKMGAFYGIYETYQRPYFLVDALTAPYVEHLYPEEPTIDMESWAAINDYYLELAPESLAGSKAEQDLLELDQFRSRPVFDTTGQVPPYTTLLCFDPTKEEIITGGPASGIRTFSNQHELLSSSKLSSTPSSFTPQTDRLLLMGSLLPSDLPRGSIIRGNGEPLTGFPDSLARPVDMVEMDLDQNGIREIIVAEYGNIVGYLKSYEQGSDGSYHARTLQKQPGALRLRSADLDNDGFEDLIVLFAQGDESVIAYLSRPDTVERRRLLRFPPSYGSSDIEIVDFDGDGDLDIVYSNGDNFDYQPIPKPYHGVRIYLNDGAGDFKETYFYPMDGAYDIAVDDYDLDGDQDIAAIAYFVPPTLRASRSFVFLEQQEPDGDAIVFTAASFIKESDQHFLVLESGDVDADGDTDLLIGSFSAYLPDGMRGQTPSVGQGPVYVYLENLAR